MNPPGVWCRSSAHESQHCIVNGKPACGTARLDKWDAWRLVMPDELDVTKQCTRCRGHLPAAVDMTAKFREWGRMGGRIGGKSVSLAKRRAALQNGRKRQPKPPLGSLVLSV